jgi:hypothetical protein
MDWPSGTEATPTHINSMMMSYFPDAEGRWIGGLVGNPASVAWPAERLIMIIPFSIPHPYLIKRFFWANGSTAGGEWLAGVYSNGFTKLVETAATLASGSNLLQYANAAAEYLLTPGSYLYAIAHSSVGATQAQATTITALQGRICGLTQQTPGAFELPNELTPVTWTGTLYPFAGFTRTASGF